MNLGVSDAFKGINPAGSNLLSDLDWGTKGILDSMNLGVSDAFKGINPAGSNLLGDLDWGTKGILDSMNLGVSDAFKGINPAGSNLLGDLDWGTKGILDSMNLGVSDAFKGINPAGSNLLSDLDWGTKGILDSMNLGVSDAFKGINPAGSNLLSDLDWGTKGILDSMNLGVSDAFKGINPAGSNLLGDLDWGLLSAIPSPVPIHPKRQHSVQMSREPQKPLDVCRNHDLLDSFDNQVTFTGLIQCTRALFADGHYSVAVEKAFVYVEYLVKQRSGLSGKYGSNLMQTVFSVHNPLISLNAGATDSDRDEQLGYMDVFAGAMTGIRNPRAHSSNWVDEPKETLELLAFANHLVRKVLMGASSRNTK